MSLLGRGGSALVFKAQCVDTGRLVALKVLHPDVDGAGAPPAQPPAARGRQLAREIRLCAPLRHPNIVILLDHGRTAGGQPFAVFELLAGHTLRELLVRHGALAPAAAGEVMRQVLAALVYLHEKGLVHRDVTPRNIMVEHVPRGTGVQVTLFDLGIAAARSRHGAPAPASAFPAWRRLCSPAYCSPEQLRGEAPTEDNDLYAWGLVLLECLTGQAVVAGHNVAEILHRQLSGAGVPLPAALRGHPLAALLRQVFHSHHAQRGGDARSLYRLFCDLDLAGLPASLRAMRTGRRAQPGLAGTEPTQACPPCEPKQSY